VGVIGAVKDFKLLFLPEAGWKLITVLAVRHDFPKASIVCGWGRVDGKIATEGKMKISLTS
jgi:hypothetical protein